LGWGFSKWGKAFPYLAGGKTKPSHNEGKSSSDRGERGKARGSREFWWKKGLSPGRFKTGERDRHCNTKNPPTLNQKGVPSKQLTLGGGGGGKLAGSLCRLAGKRKDDLIVKLNFPGLIIKTEKPRDQEVKGGKKRSDEKFVHRKPGESGGTILHDQRIRYRCE